jgi:membrane-associated phospholipid phosphatase
VWRLEKFSGAFPNAGSVVDRSMAEVSGGSRFTSRLADLGYRSEVRASEWVPLAYFSYLAGVCWLRPVPMRQRVSVTAASVALAAAIAVLASAAPSRLRDWLPFVYVAFGYYVTGWLFIEPSQTLEQWLLGWDHRLFGDPTARFAAWPAWFVAYLDIVYMCLFLLLPAGLAALVLAGHEAQANHYWTMVLTADLGAFAPLSVFQTRPPWALEPRARLADGPVRRLAERMVRTTTICVNTFPSGHVAVAFSIALAVLPTLPLVGGALLGLAVTVSIACIVGRYHYAVDVAAGLVLAIAVFTAVTLLGI